jgi:predicted lipid-binding transport protein (Tim44 family)
MASDPLAAYVANERSRRSPTTKPEEKRMSGKPRVLPKQPRAKSVFASKPPVREPDPGNLPEVSKQTAGGIAGAMIGGVVAGPLGAIAGGVAGALIGNASAEGKRPIGRTVDNIREVTEEPARKAYARISNAMSRKKTPATKAPAKKPAAKKIPAKKTSRA